MRVVAVAFVVAAAPAAADPSVRARAAAEDDGPLLELDPELRTEVEGIGAKDTVVARSSIALGPRARASTETTLWANDRTALARGWTVVGRVAYAVGWNTTLSLDGTLARTLGGVERADGTYGTAGVALTKFLRWSHGRVAWISLGIELARWFGTGPAPAPDGRTAGLKLGTTF